MMVEEFFNKCHGKDGRFCGSGVVGSRDVPQSVASKVLRATLKHGGATIDPRTGASVTSGYSVGVRPKASQMVPVTGASKAQVAKWLKDNAAELAKPGHHIGSWHDEKTGQVWLDVVKVYPNDAKGRAGALAAAGRHKQIAIFHLDKMQEIEKKNAAQLREEYSSGPGMKPGFSKGRETVPLKEFGVSYRKGTEHIPAVADARRMAAETPDRWKAAKLQKVRLSELNASESHVKSKYIERVLAGEPLRKGYDPFVLIDKRGRKFLIDGHHRVAMHSALGHDTMNAHVIDLRKRSLRG